MNRIYTPCDDCAYSYSQQNQENNMCKICEFEVYKTNPDIVEVVRCKDCRFFEADDGLKDGVLCLQHGHKFSVPKPDDFCSYGERREKLEEAK